MKIGIISDTHKKLKKAKKALAMLLENGAEFIVHAGDIVDVRVLELLKDSGTRYVAVYGNNDKRLVQYQDIYNLVEEPYYFKLADTNFKLMHLPYYMAGDTEVILFGHTHVFQSEFTNGSLFLNPGEVCARDVPISSCVMLEIQDTTFEVTRYTRKKKTKIFEEEKFTYTRVPSE